MTDTVTDAPRGTAPRRRRTLLILTAAAVLGVLAAAGLWVTGRVPGSPPPEGPLEGTHFEELTTQLRPADTGLLWGSLLLHNGTGQDVVLEEATLADNPDGIIPITEPYVWDTDRFELLNTGAVSSYQLPLPADWKIPPKHPVPGFVVHPHHDEADSVEILFELPVPRHATTLKGIAVRYRIGSRTFRNVYDVTQVICPPAETEPCK